MNKSEKFWDNVSKNFDKSEKRFEKIHQQVVEKAKIYLNSNHTVLDYGCGPGTKTLELAGDTEKITGIDISSKMIEIAKSKVIENKIENAEFIHTNIFDDGLTKESYNVVLAFNILHVLKDKQQIINRIIELLKPGGLFISMTPCLKEKMAISNRIQLFVYRVLITFGIMPDILTRFKFSELENLFIHKNLKLEETEKIYHSVSGCFKVVKKV